MFVLLTLHAAQQKRNTIQLDCFPITVQFANHDLYYQYGKMAGNVTIDKKFESSELGQASQSLHPQACLQPAQWELRSGLCRYA